MHGLIAIFSMEDPESVTSLDTMIDKAMSKSLDPEDVKVMVVGTKNDTPSDDVNLTEMRTRYQDKNYFFHVTSAKDATGVNEAFDYLTYELVEE